MKLATIAALSVLIVLPAEAGHRHQQIGSPAATCDNDGHCTTLTTKAPAPSFHRSRSKTQTTIATTESTRLVDANGNTAGVIISGKTGARARVGVAYAARFQSYIDDLENNHGARVMFMGGIRPGRCSVSSEHPCGKALDVCQLRRGVADPRCNLPGRVAMGEIAASHGLFEGGRWCNSDYGHAQVDVTAAACADRRTRIVQQN